MLIIIKLINNSLALSLQVTGFGLLHSYDVKNVTDQNQSLVRNELGHYFINLTLFYLIVLVCVFFKIVDKISTQYVERNLTWHINDVLNGQVWLNDQTGHINIMRCTIIIKRITSFCIAVFQSHWPWSNTFPLITAAIRKSSQSFCFI